MDLIQTLAIFLVVVTIIVTVHELGHFLAARLSGMRVDIFSIGMGPRLLGYNCQTGWSFGTLPESWEPQGCTDYRISLFPIGGYVKIAGMVDESLDTQFLRSEPQPWEFRAKPRLAQAFVISAGVLMNFLLAILVFSGIALSQGKTIIETTRLGTVPPNSFAAQIGLQSGDEILAVDDVSVQNWNHFLELLTTEAIGETKQLTVRRAGKVLTLSLDSRELLRRLNESQSPDQLGFIPDAARVFVAGVLPGTPAEQAGLQPGDTILKADDQPIYSLQQLIATIKAHKSTPLPLTWKRGDQILQKIVTPDSSGKLGISITVVFTNIRHVQYSLPEAIGYGIDQTGKTIVLFFESIRQIFRGKLSVKETIGGPIRIAEMASQQAGLGIMAFLQFVAFLSITLAIINILPIPALDGGHLLLIVIEGIFRRELPAKIKIAIQQIGIALLLLLMVFIIYNDLTR